MTEKYSTIPFKHLPYCEKITECDMAKRLNTLIRKLRYQNYKLKQQLENNNKELKNEIIELNERLSGWQA